MAKTDILIGAVRQIKPIGTHFRGLFGTRTIKEATVTLHTGQTEAHLAIASAGKNGGARRLAHKKYTSQKYGFPTFPYRVDVQASEFDNVQFGQILQANGMGGMSVDAQGEFIATMASKIQDESRETINAMARSLEKMAVETVRDGVVNFTDDNGDTVAPSIDYKRSSTLTKQTGTAWSDTGADIIGDFEDVCDGIRAITGMDPNEATVGATAFQNILLNAVIKDRANFRRVGTLEMMPAPRRVPTAAKFQGWLDIGNYRLALYTYPNSYKEPNTGVDTPYMGTNDCTVYVNAESNMLDFVYQEVMRMPNPGNSPEWLRALVPGSFEDVDDLNMAILMHPFISENATAVTVEMEMRPVPVVADINTTSKIITTV